LGESAPTLSAVIDPAHLASSLPVIVRAAAVLTCCAITARTSD